VNKRDAQGAGRRRPAPGGTEPSSTKVTAAASPASKSVRRRPPPVVLATAAALLLSVLAGGVLVLTQGWGRPTPTTANRGLPGVGERPAEQIDASGRLLLPIDAGLSLVTLPDRAIRQLVDPGRSGAVTGVAWAPDGTSAAYAFYHLRPGDSAASSELYLSDLKGEPRLLLERDRPGATVEAPVWAPGGTALYFGYSAIENQRVVRRVERLDIATGTRTAIGDGAFPAVSPDGGTLASIRSDRNGDNLVLSQADGRDARVLIPSGRFTALGTPRFAPDGHTVAVPISVNPGQAAEPSSGRRFGLLAPSVAYAHGDPWDVYLVDVAGGEPRRLTRMLEDEISIAWSPDGSQIAVYGSRGLYLVDAEGRATYALDRGGFGGIDWAR
jgi:Tol biopolymer transport system component